MDGIPNELNNLICNNITKICDLRNISKTSKYFQNLCKNKITNMENYYKEKYNNLSFMKYFGHHTKEKFTIEIILDGYYGLLSDKYYKNNQIICSMCAFVGNLKLLEYSMAKSCPYDNYIIKCAAYGGQLEILECLHKDFGAIDSMNCHRNTNCISNVYDYVLFNACCNDKVNVLDWVKLKINDGCKLDYSHYKAITRFNSLNIVLWMINNNVINEDFIKLIIKNDNTIILQLLYDNKIPINQNSYKDAIKYGSYNVLKWLKYNKFEIGNDIFLFTIQGDNPDMLRWCDDNNIGIDSQNIYKICIDKGYFNSFKWLYDNGKPISENIYNHFNNTTNTEIVELCIVNKVIRIPQLYNRAIGNNFCNLLKIILKHNTEKLSYTLTNTNLDNNCSDILKSYDLVDVYFDPYLFDKTTSVIQHILKYQIVQPKFHVYIMNKKVFKENHEGNCNKIVTIDDKCVVKSENLDCKNKCWFYFFGLWHNNVYNNKYCKDCIDNCDIHRIFLEKL